MTASTHHSLLKSLRSVVPHRSASFDEALQVAELQATKLLELISSADGVHEADLAALPRLRVVREPDLMVSGMSHWNGTCWIITINATDSLVRQRFTLLHEFKHVLDHGHTADLYASPHRKTQGEQAETAADYFAGCALVPKRQLKSMWGNGMQTVPALASHFGVSEHAVRVRLTQTGLDAVRDSEPTPRCARPVATPRRSNQRFTVAHRSYARRMYT